MTCAPSRHRRRGSPRRPRAGRGRPALGVARVEIDQQIATAHRYPRSLKRTTTHPTLATLDEVTAEAAHLCPAPGRQTHPRPVRAVGRDHRRPVEELPGRGPHQRDQPHRQVRRGHRDLPRPGDERCPAGDRAKPDRGPPGRLYNDDMIYGDRAGRRLDRPAQHHPRVRPEGRLEPRLSRVRAHHQGDVQTLSERRSKAIPLSAPGA